MSTALKPVPAGAGNTVAARTDYAGMLAVAEQLVKSGFLPEYIKTPGQACAIIMAGDELGMRPMLALRSIQMVKGKIVVSADAQLALFKTQHGRAQFTTLTEAEAVLELVHPNGDRHVERFTIEDAKKAGLAGKGTWQQFPKAMLRSRCITAGLKSVGFEPTSGAYDPDEAAHFDGFTTAVEVVDVSGAQPEKQTEGKTEAAIVHDLAWAKAFPLPWRKHKHFNEPVDTRSDPELKGALDWTISTIAKGGAEGQEPSQMLLDFKEALTLVIEDRAAVIEREQTKLDLDPAKEVAAPAASQSHETPKPGKVADALGDEDLSKKELYRQTDEFLKHPAIEQSRKDAYNKDKVNGFKEYPQLWWYRHFKGVVEAAEKAGEKAAESGEMPDPRGVGQPLYDGDTGDGLPF